MNARHQLRDHIDGSPFSEPASKLSALADDEFPIVVMHDVDAYDLALMRSPDSLDPNFFGWIQLRKGEQPVGYIYIQSENEEPHLGSPDTSCSPFHTICWPSFLSD